MRSAPLRHPDKWSTRLREKLTDGGCRHPSSTRHSDEMRFSTDTPHSDNDTMTRVVRPLDADRMAHRLDTSIPETSPQQLETSMTQWLGDNQLDTSTPETSPQQLKASMSQWLRTIRWRDDTTRGLRIGSRTWWYNEYYDDEMSEKATMQIGRKIAKGILSRFDSF